MLEYKNLMSEIKANDTGILSGFASTTALDSDNDRISTGAFRNSLEEARGQFSLCWQHDMRTVIGDIKLELGKGRIPLTGQLNFTKLDGIPCMPKAFEAYALMKQAEKMTGNRKPGFSIGFRTLKSKPNTEGGRDISEIDLFEVSIVTLPANPGAIGIVKQIDFDENFYEGFYNWMLKKGLFGEEIEKFFKQVDSPGSHLEKIRRNLSGG